jgi:alpha-tubulin suppressor-like RCC1 family protein
LGIGNTTNKTTPTAVTTLTSNTTGITMGALSACAIRAGGAFCWGDNVTGNLGTGNTTLSNVPVAAISTSDAVPVSLSTGVIDIASNENSSNAPYNSTCFLKESGAVICTGYNQFRQLTNNSNVQSNTPVRSVYYTSNVTEIDMGQYSFCAIMSGAARCLGATPVAGDGTGNSPSTPSNVTGMTGLDPESYRANISSSAFVPPTYVGTGHSIVSATPTEFSGYPSPSVSYSWLACDDNVGGSSAATPSSCSPIANATSSSFILTSAQFGKHIRLQSQATNTLGTKSFVSAATIASGTPPSASGGSNYSGSQAAGPLPGLALSSSTTTSFTGTPMPTGSSAWVRCATEVTTTTYSGIDGTLPSGCSLISGATSATYKLSQADVGFYVSPAQIATTSAGQSVAFGPSTAIVRGGQRVAMSMSHTCAIKSGLVYCWGTNTNGQLGSGNTTSTTKPSEVPVRFADGSLLKDAIAVSVTTAHSCALTNDGSVYCWGINSKGQLGNGTTTQQNFPVQVLASAGTPFTGATAVATGGDNTCVIKSAQLYCFGGNTSGQIGKGVVEASTNYTYPLLNTALSTGVQRVTMAAQNTTCALKLAQAYCWGFQGLMLLGFPSASAVATPTLLAVNGTAFSNVSTITLGGYAGCLVSSSVLHCWGGATTGANGFGGNMTSPTRVSGMPSNITQIVSSPNTASASTCFTTISETVYCAGGNDYGNYLYNHASSGLTSFRLTTTISGISEIANGDRSTCFVANKALKCVGFNGSGQVGIGSSQPTYYPGTPSGMDKYVGYEDLAPVLSVSTTGFTTPSATLLGKAEAADGRQTFGFPYPSLSSSWNTCTEIGAAANSLPADCSPTPSAVGDALSLSNDDLGSKFRYSVPLPALRQL